MEEVLPSNKCDVNRTNKGSHTIGIILDQSSHFTLIVAFKFQWVDYVREENDQDYECTQKDREGPCLRSKTEGERGERGYRVPFVVTRVQ